MEMSKNEQQTFLKRCSRFLCERNHAARLQFLFWEGHVDQAKNLLSLVSLPIRKLATLRIAFLEQCPPQRLPPTNDEGVCYEVVKWHKKQKQFYEAAKILFHELPSGKYAQKWWKERHYVAREMIALKDYQKAYLVLKHHALEPGTESFSDAEWLLGWLSLRFLNKPKEAQRHFETFNKYVKAAISKARGAYWLGRTYEAQKQLALAEKAYRKAARYRTTYYGQLAAAKLRENPYPPLALASKVTGEEKKKFHQKELVKAAHILGELGKAATTELTGFLSLIGSQAQTKGERELAVELAHRLSPHDVVWVAKKAGNADPVLLKVAFPTCSLPKGQSQYETALLHAIAYKESHFNPRAESPKGAKGLLQLMPQAAAEAAQRLNIPHTDKKVFDPKHNLLLGSDHLCTLLNDFQNSYVLVAAAYNAGPTPVGRWLRDIGDPHAGEVDVIDWIELIPDGETRNYVQRVIENVNNYRSREGIPQKTIVDDLKKRT